MPKKSERERLLSEILDLTAILEEEDDEDYALAGNFAPDETLWSSPVEELQEVLFFANGSRFLKKRKVIPMSVEFAQDGFDKLPDDEFRQMTRMSRTSIYRVFAEIEDHPVFSNNSMCEQKPVWLQLAVARDRLDNYGNGASIGRARKHRCEVHRPCTPSARVPGPPVCALAG